VEADGPQLFGQAAVPASGIGLALQGTQVAAHLLQKVGEPVHVDGGGLQAPLGPLLALAVLEDAGRLLDHRPAVLGTGVKDGVEAALAHDDVLGAPDPGIRQQFLDVEEPAGLTVHGVAGLPVPGEGPSDAQLGAVEGEEPLGVVDGERDFGLGGRRAPGGAGEDHVVHLAAPQGAGPLGSEHPGHGVDDVGFPRAVGADDHGDPGLEGERRAIGEGLEALERQ
jgi:hypothetical protein